ncbi:hypothetical protein GCM10017668_62370 [Streptomyces tuirus]|uniref:Uncharacterized protein n=1 Tax=Streptomyces tuirus TaxID=68278 RepID=A0A7G1NS25_9ACTN|nr:hypothetical protein GCM10017668_62370 [Streptomyces tuirus]
MGAGRHDRDGAGPGTPGDGWRAAAAARCRTEPAIVDELKDWAPQFAGLRHFRTGHLSFLTGHIRFLTGHISLLTGHIRFRAVTSAL